MRLVFFFGHKCASTAVYTHSLTLQFFIFIASILILVFAAPFTMTFTGGVLNAPYILTMIFAYMVGALYRIDFVPRFEVIFQFNIGSIT